MCNRVTTYDCLMLCARMLAILFNNRSEIGLLIMQILKGLKVKEISMRFRLPINIIIGPRLILIVCMERNTLFLSLSDIRFFMLSVDVYRANK